MFFLPRINFLGHLERRIKPRQTPHDGRHHIGSSGFWIWLLILGMSFDLFYIPFMSLFVNLFIIYICTYLCSYLFCYLLTFYLFLWGVYAHMYFLLICMLFFIIVVFCQKNILYNWLQDYWIHKSCVKKLNKTCTNTILLTEYTTQKLFV